MQSNRLALVAPLSILLVASSVNYACTNDNDDTTTADAGVYVDGGIQYGVPPGAGTAAPGDDDDTTGDDASTSGDDTSTGTDGSTGTDSGTDGSTGGGTALSFAVLRLGDGTAALPTAQTTVAAFIDYYKSDGTSGGTSLAIPSTTFSVPESTSAGGMTLSTDGHYLVLGGFGAKAGTANSSALNRVAARINAAGTVDTSTVIGAFNTSATSEIRSVASVDGTSFWTVGTGTPDGTCWSPFGDNGSGALQLENVPATTRDVGIFAGQLYVTAATTTAPDFVGVGPVGTGTPKVYVTNGTATPLTGMGTGNTSPYGFVGFDTDTTAGIDLIYIADATTGVEKWQLGSSSTWAKVGTAVKVGTGTGARSVAGSVSSGAVTLLATSFDGSTIAKITDTVSSTTNGTGTTLVSAATNEGFRGIALAPN